MCELPTEYVLYDNNTFNVYIDNKVHTMEFEDDPNESLYEGTLFPLPNYRFISIKNSDEDMIIIGNYNNDKLIKYDDISINIHDLPPVVNGNFVYRNIYYKINPDNTIEIIPLKNNATKIIPANNKSNIDDLLVVDKNMIYKYNSDKKFYLSSDILAWFDNRYIVTIPYQAFLNRQNITFYDMQLGTDTELSNVDSIILTLDELELDNIDSTYVYTR